MATGRMTVGAVEILALSDAVVDYPWPLEQLFPGVPADAWEPYRRRYPAAFGAPDMWRSNYGCYLLRSQGRTVLVDTGMGPAGAPLPSALQLPGGRLHELLQAAGVQPEQVEMVLLTHLHPDHVGGTVHQQDGAHRLAFPRARYLVHRADWEAFQRPEVQQHLPFPYVDETITPLQRLGALDLIAGDHPLTAELTTLHTPGHTPGHLSVLITSGDERAVLTGDVVVHPAQVTEPDWNLMFETDGEVARQTRHGLLARIEAEGMAVAAGHFPAPGFGRLVHLEGRRYWQGL